MSTSPSHPTIQTPRLLLRAGIPSDAEAIHRIRTHPDIVPWTTSTTMDPISTTEEWIQRTFFSGVRKFTFVITLSSAEKQEKGEVIGILNMRLPANTSLPTIAYEIAPGQWNRGYLTEALTAFLGAYWEVYPEGMEGSKRDENGRVSVDAAVMETNGASLRVLEKVGFTFLGEERVEDWYGGPDVVLRRFRVWKPEV